MTRSENRWRRRRECLQELRKRITELPPNEQLADTSDKNLVRVLSSRKYDMDEALKSTVQLRKFNDEHPEWTQGSRARKFLALKMLFQVTKGCIHSVSAPVQRHHDTAAAYSRRMTIQQQHTDHDTVAG